MPLKNCVLYMCMASMRKSILNGPSAARHFIYVNLQYNTPISAIAKLSMWIPAHAVLCSICGGYLPRVVFPQPPWWGTSLADSEQGTHGRAATHKHNESHGFGAGPGCVQVVLGLGEATRRCKRVPLLLLRAFGRASREVRCASCTFTLPSRILFVTIL